jgi:hypothetical protein
MSDKSYYGVDDMSQSDRDDFLSWYEQRKGQVFYNRGLLVQYCQDDFTVLRQACQMFRAISPRSAT